MPTYICHGFRWPRPLIRIHIILQNLDDAAPEWLMAPRTADTMLHNFKTIYPDIMTSLSTLRFLEQYDPSDESVESKSQPYAYVCDVVHEVKLGIEVDEVRGKGVHNDAWTAMMDLRDKLAPGEKVSWFVVVCGDLERWSPPESSAVPVAATNGSNTLHTNGRTNGHTTFSSSRSSWGREDSEASRPSTSRSLKKLFGGGGLRKSKSMKSINTTASLPTSPNDVPPLPQSPRAFNHTAQAPHSAPPVPPPKSGPNITHVYARLPPELRNPTPVAVPPEKSPRQVPGQVPGAGT